MSLIPEAPCGNNTLRHRLAHLTGSHALSVCMMAYGAQVSEGLAEGIRKGSGNMLTEMPKVGERIRYVSGYFNDYTTLGHVYEINEIKYGCAYFVDDSGESDNRSIIGKYDFGHFELVTEPSPSIVDLVANLGRRLSEVEATLAPDDSDSDASDTESHSVICAELTETYARKNEDYGDSFSQQYDEHGILSSVIRLDDKMRRIKQLTVNGAKVNDESIEDTLLDLANYSIMTLMELRK